VEGEVWVWGAVSWGMLTGFSDRGSYIMWASLKDFTCRDSSDGDISNSGFPD
jgi:hypothetical protein